MSYFNSVQLKCYILLKIIKKELINPNNPESLTSYHIKTCMLYMKEKTPAEFWRPENLLGCMLTALKVLSRWAKEGNCPDYFIPDENMFDRLSETRYRHSINSCRIFFLPTANTFYTLKQKILEHLPAKCAPSIATLSYSNSSATTAYETGINDQPGPNEPRCKKTGLRGF